MERAILSVLMILLSGRIGFTMANRLKKRTEQLRLLISMLEEMSALMKYRAVPTDELLKILSKQPSFCDSEFLELFKRERELPFREAWCAAAEKTASLSEDDRRILLYLGERLGTTDPEGQLSLFSISREFAERALAEAEEEYRVKGQLIRKVSLLCGAAVGILIL